MQVPQEINLNFIKTLQLRQAFREVSPEKWELQEEEMNIYFSLYHKLLSLYAEQRRLYEPHTPLPPSSHSRLPLKGMTTTSDLSSRPEALQDSKTLLTSDSGLQAFLQDLRRIPFYKTLLNISEMVASGYIHTWYNPYKVYGGSKVDLGPIYSFWNENSIEGRRLSLGGRTTSYLSPYLFASGHVAYGLRDKQWKHRATISLSLNPKRYFLEEFPRHEIAFTSEYDLFTPGQIYANDNKDNLLYNIGTSYLTDRSYRRRLQLDYRQDFLNGLSLSLYARKVVDSPTGSLSYVRVSQDLSLQKIPFVETGTLGIFIRFAPGERIYEGSLKRYKKVRISRAHPIFSFRYEHSSPLLGSDYTINRTEMGLEQLFWIGSFGSLEYNLSLGKIWNSVPFPMLYTPPTNRAWRISKDAFQLLHPLEYIGDEYLSFFSSYHMRGWLLNKVPLLNRLHLRGVLSFNYLHGNTSILNRAETSKEKFVLPTSATEMRNTPYAEVGFGFENILRVLRIDLFHRISQPSDLSLGRWGVKGELRINF